MLHRPDEPHAAFDLAVVEHDEARGSDARAPDRSLTRAGTPIGEVIGAWSSVSGGCARAFTMVSNRVSAPVPGWV